ncbi:hypothetical protein [uncultured Sphingomonas sp.]|mgnify:CR=1 FL=1|uniref:EF-hand domain-containing protein n=1 Tax=uncultured Sphingomonas sp. TaxID=158754 RepID=UPI0025F9D44E|nr:hypothetical protein [uncultured Sphingomonas sp.]
MRKTLIGLSLVAMLTAQGAYAQSDAPPPLPHGRMGGGLMGLRPDANGNITRDAAIAAADQRFAAMDANHDGTVSPEEMQAYREQMRAQWQSRRPQGDRAGRPDRPAPQPVTAEAYRARALAMFDRLDANHDGKIDATERAAMPRFGRHGPHGAAPASQPAPQGD